MLYWTRRELGRNVQYIDYSKHINTDSSRAVSQLY